MSRANDRRSPNGAQSAGEGQSAADQRPDSTAGGPRPPVRDQPRSGPRSRFGLRSLFYLILAILAARPLISEQYERLDLEFLEAAAAPEGPSPATTAILDTLLLGAASAALATGGRWRRAGPLGLASAALLLAAVVVSSLAADDRQLALLAGSSLCAALVGGFALHALAEERWMRGLALAALLATGGVTALKSIRQFTDEWHATRAYWEQELKPALLKQGYREDDRLIINFERRMMAREAHGYVGHPNINASILAMTGVAAAGVAIAAFASAGVAGGLAGLALAAAAALAGWFTGSLGAAAAAVAGVLTLLIAGRSARTIALHRRAVLAGLALTYFAALGAVAAYGLAKGTLPHPSLEFRWHYWSAAARVYAEAPLTGVGRLNFAPAYMRFKSAESTEEVRDPHNLWISLLVELGPLGLAAGVLIFGLITWSALASLRPSPETAPPPERRGRMQIASRRVAPLVILFAFVHAALSATPFSVPGMALTWAFDIPVPWAILALVAMLILGDAELAGRGERWIAAGILGGIVVALVHGTLDFALMTPGGLAFFTLLAATAPCEHRHETRPAGRLRHLAAAALLAAAIGHVGFVTLPAGHSAALSAALEQELAQRATTPIPQKWRSLAANAGDAALRRRVVRATLAGLKSWPFDPNACRELFEWTESAAARLAHDQPRNSNHFALLADVRAARATFATSQRDGPAADRFLHLAAEAAERAAELYSTNPRARISAGWAWLKVADGDESAITRARNHFIEALRIDDLRKPEEVQRLRPAEREPVETWLRANPQ